MKSLEKIIVKSSSVISKLPVIGNFYNKFVGAISLGINNHEFSYFSDRNGEDSLLIRSLKELAKTGEEIVIFDAGCNRGTYTTQILRICAEQSITSINIHLFDIDPKMIRACVQLFKEDNRIIINGFGLSNLEQISQARFYPDDTTRNSLLGTSEEVGWDYIISDTQLVRGDAYCMKHGIEYIHFLKLDLEGHDFEALKGFENMLKLKKIKYIQFEYTFRALERRILLKDFYEQLASYGYKFGCIKYDKIEVIENYNPRLENWLMGPNFFAFTL